MGDNMFDRLIKIIGNSNFSKIQKLNVLLIGIGGVGGYTLETLTRMGIQNITIVDNDTIDITNLNRQLISNHNNINQSKVIVAQQRMLEINPQINIKTINKLILPSNINELNIEYYDYIIDACDTISTKIALINEAHNKKIKIITCLGTGNRLDSTKLEITTLDKTSNDPVAKIMRKSINNINHHKIKVIWSREVPVKTHEKTPGSSVLVPSVAGIYLTSYIINDILNKE